jgi:hypothetical protein
VSKRSIKRLILNIFLVILLLNVGVLGYRLTQDPDDLVEITLDKKSISPREDLHIIVHNYGLKGVFYGGGESIYRLYANDTIEHVKYPENVAWSLRYYTVYPLIGNARVNIYTDHLEPGNYLIKWDFKIRGIGEFYKILSFTVR